MFKTHLSALALAGGLLISSYPSGAGTFSEDFSGDPAARGWQVFGDTNLFHWDATNNHLAVTWDSSQPNSYFHRPLGTILTRSDDFSLAFDLRLDDIVSGNESNKTGGLEIALGFLNHATATSTNFMRGAFGSAPSLVEFDYFPAGYYDFGGSIFDVAATTTPTFISTNSFHFAPTVFAPYTFELPTNRVVHVAMTYTASNQTLITILTTNGALLFQPPNVVLTDTNSSGFNASDDFRVDTFSISSYSSAGDDFDSVLGHGVVDNFVVTTPPPPVTNLTGEFTNNIWQVQFISRTNWLYTFERTVDFSAWTNVSATFSGNATNLFLQDTNPPPDKAFYRVHAERP
ncbi:MAG: hypothetical protein HY298_01450 [Verrucomicrobia bacterium]|nr:hypothetical protein [Verrucomicrobiota bacterium]